MALVNHDSREVQFKIIYCGPAYGGKTTNLLHIHGKLEDAQRGELLSMATSTDRTVFFDYLPIESVLIKGYQTKFQLYTVPGQVAYNATRELVLRGADGLVFVADSSPDRVEANAEALQILEENLRGNGLTLEELPFVLQYNKRDVEGAVASEHLDMVLNQRSTSFETFETVASTGVNVFATLNAVSKEVLRRFHGSVEESIPGDVASATV
ncbi:MAG: ADP-ribosylation factor-like protein [Verrucomicrobiota bacterium]